MARMRHLSRAPIREAVLDVRIAEENPIDAGHLLSALESQEGFPEVRELTADSVPTQLPTESEAAGNPSSGKVIGARGFSRDRDWVIDFRTNGVTFSRRSPYPSWEEYSEKARPLVAQFLDVARPRRVVRVALRYINHFRLSYRDPKDYFGTLPSLPDSLGLRVDSLLSTITAHDLECELSAHVTHFLLDDLAPDRIGFLLDIDVFSDNQFGPQTDQFWGTFEELRKFKNRIFFELITERNAVLHE